MNNIQFDPAAEIIGSLTAENEQLKKELQTAILTNAKLADEKVALRLELDKQNLYAELGRLMYKNDNRIEFRDVKIYYEYININSQIQESEGNNV